MKAILTILCLVILSTIAQAQLPFTACLYDASVVLTVSEIDNTPLPDGTPGYIYWDLNLNGPDPSDTLVPLCDAPPECLTGPVGTYNMNTFALNGTEMGLGAGLFYMDVCFQCAFVFPSPPRYYLKVVGPEVTWVSAVFVCVPGPQSIEITSWSVEPPLNPVCDPPSLTTWLGLPNLYYSPRACLCLSPDAPGGEHIFYVGPVWDSQNCLALHPDGIDPPIFINPGCDTCGNPDCLPASGWTFDGHLDWTVINDLYYYVGHIIMPPGSQAGCACIRLVSFNEGYEDDCWLPVTLGTFTALPKDNAVELSWNTLSETAAARFELLRDGTRIHIQEATNTSTEHVYKYTDQTAQNGTIYSYQLLLINMDNSSEILATQSATPSAEHALVSDYALYQNYPNPFNPSTRIRFDLVDAGSVSLKVFDVTGREVATLVNGKMNAGAHTVSLDASSLPSGLYFYTLKTEGFAQTRKMLLVK